jgi:hypothetical protein
MTGKTCVCYGLSHPHLMPTIIDVGRRRYDIDRSWSAKGPSTITPHTATGTSVHRIKVDEKAGYILTTKFDGGLTVTDLEEEVVLWSLPKVRIAFPTSTSTTNKPFNRLMFAVMHTASMAKASLYLIALTGAKKSGAVPPTTPQRKHPASSPNHNPPFSHPNTSPSHAHLLNMPPAADTFSPGRTCTRPSTPAPSAFPTQS